jgi:hypothetical protein
MKEKQTPNGLRIINENAKTRKALEMMQLLGGKSFISNWSK